MSRPSDERLLEVFSLLEAHIERRYQIPVRINDVPDPFTGDLDGAEIHVDYREDIESEGIMPAMIAAITGYSLYSSIVGSSTVFTTPDYQFINPLELLPLVLFALVCAVVGIFYTNIFYGTRNLFSQKLEYLLPSLGT